MENTRAAVVITSKSESFCCFVIFWFKLNALASGAAGMHESACLRPTTVLCAPESMQAPQKVSPVG